MYFVCVRRILTRSQTLKLSDTVRHDLRTGRYGIIALGAMDAPDHLKNQHVFGDTQAPTPYDFRVSRATFANTGRLRRIISNAVTRGFKQPPGIALQLIYRAENRCKSSGAPAGAFPKPPRGWVDPGSGRKSPISGPPSPIKTQQKHKLV